MALTSLADLSIVDANNTSFSGITQAENSMLPSNVNDAFRATDGSIARYLSDLAGINQTVGGTANAITVTVAQTWTALANGQRMAIKNTVGPNTAATTIAVTNSVAGALGTKAIRLQGDSALVGGEMLANGIYEFRYDTSYNAAAGAWVLLNPAVSSSATTSNAPFTNFAIGTPTVAASALTITFTGVDGNAISASNTAYVNFRSVTAGSGAISQIALTAAQSLVVPSGASLGSVNAIATTYALAAFNNAGAIIYGIINPTTLPLVDGIATTTLLSGASTSAGVWYTTTALTAKAYTIIGYFTATEATAGTWATAPSTVQVGSAPAATNAISPGAIKLGTAVNTTSGTSIDFTGLPPWISQIIMNLGAVSTTGASSLVIRIGDSAGGFSATGYSGGSVGFSTSGLGSSTETSGAVIKTPSGTSSTANGTIILTKINTTTWAIFGGAADTAVVGGAITYTSKILGAGPLDRIRLTTVGGTDTFDAGILNIAWC